MAAERIPTNGPRGRKSPAALGELKRLQEELLAIRTELEDFYNKAACGHHSLDEKGMFLRINDTELGWLGYTREEVVGRKSFGDLITPRCKALFQKQFAIFKERGSIKDLEFEMVRKDGSILPVLLSATAIKSEDGRYLASRSTIIEITKRKQVEQQMLKEQEELERRVAERTAALVSANQRLVEEIDMRKRSSRPSPKANNNCALQPKNGRPPSMRFRTWSLFWITNSK